MDKLPRYTDSATAQRLQDGEPVPHELIGCDDHQPITCAACGDRVLRLRRGFTTGAPLFSFQYRGDRLIAQPHAPRCSGIWRVPELFADDLTPDQRAAIEREYLGLAL